LIRTPSQDSDTDVAPEFYSEQPSFAIPPLNVVSLQSTSRPGCIIELVPIADAIQVSQRTLVITRECGVVVHSVVSVCMYVCNAVNIESLDIESSFWYAVCYGLLSGYFFPTARLPR